VLIKSKGETKLFDKRRCVASLFIVKGAFAYPEIIAYVFASNQ